MRMVFTLIVVVVVSFYFTLRTCVDRKIEQRYDKEIVREKEEHLGSWAAKTGAHLFIFRLHRNGTYTGKDINQTTGDTIVTKGRYNILGPPGKRLSPFYPRLIVRTDNNDTLFNYYISSITPYDSKVEKVDRMVLQPNSLYDTVSYIFYRVNQ